MRSLLDPVLESHARLFSSTDVAADIYEALARVGSASDVDRTYVFEVTTLPDGSHVASHRYEWVREGIEPELDNPELQAVPLQEAGYGRWIRLLSDYQPVFGLVEEFPVEEQPLLVMQDILSLLVIPIFSDGELWGFVGFDDCRRRKVWTRSDVNLLLSLSIAIGARLGSRGPGPHEIDAGATSYMEIVRGLVGLRDLTGSRQPLSDLLQQIRARIRALVAIHRFLVRGRRQPAIDIAALLSFWEGEIREALDDCGQHDLRLRMMAESFDVPRELVLETALVIHELVLAYSCTNAPSERHGTLSLGVHEEQGTAVVRLRLEGREADEESSHGAPDALGLVLVRRIVQALAGNVEIPAADAAARIVIPLQGKMAGSEMEN
jgi:two-component sensor histidine kinase